MNCLQYRREKLADPRRGTDASRAHEEACPACRAFARRLDVFEDRLAEVVRVPVPEGLAERALLGARRQRARSLRAWALAASVLIAALAIWPGRVPPPEFEYAHVGIEHVSSQDEPGARRALATAHGEASADPRQFQSILAGLGAHVQGRLGEILYIHLCPLPVGGTGWHFVLDTEAGRATVILVPPPHVRPQAGPSQAHFAGYSAWSEPSGTGVQWIVVADTPGVTAAVARLMRERVSWGGGAE
ncbi:MAG TPA: DUF3379 family protein [Rhodocyclaceae bacterium]|nr:DUF3379 family protein [Rhodocyclaceae bacterium]